MTYKWRFGDGSATEQGTLDEGNTIEVWHKYIHQKSGPYIATLTVVGYSEAGAVETASLAQVTVTESKGWLVGGYDVEGDNKDAVRSLSVVTSGLVTMGISVLVFSQLWGTGLAIVGALSIADNRRRKARKRNRQPADSEDRPFIEENFDA